VRELLLAGRRSVHEVLIALDRRDADVIDDIAALATDLGVPVREVPMRTLDRLARTDAHQGVVASADPLPDVDLDDLLGASGPPAFLLLLDGVTDPGNVGALLRTAECAGVTGVVLPRHRAAHVTPAVAKAAAGAAEHLPISLVGGLPAAIAHLRAANVWVVGLDMGGTTDVADLPAFDGPVALVLGAEGRGLSRLVRERVDVVASIPMHGRLGSLNVAAAGAIACYEIARRRRAAGSGGTAGEQGS
jgi:23S rRNA (guanosine2251-2'-O)-methyltransferase